MLGEGGGKGDYSFDTMFSVLFTIKTATDTDIQLVKTVEY